MKNTIAALTLSLLILLSFNTLANSGNSSKDIEIKGKVVDKDTGEALEYATVSLFSVQDSTLVGGVITDMNGLFTMQVAPGSYYIKVQFMGYSTRTMNVAAKKDSDVVNLGKIMLQTDSELLDEVEIVAEKSTMTMTLDKRVFNVGKDVASTAGNAIEVLENIPSVTVDVEGNVSLRGDDGVQILVDGKVSGLLGVSTQDALRSLQSDMIERIEVVTNPSVRYDAEGTAGIINIVLKKDKRKGFNGSVDVRGGFPFEWGEKMPSPFPFQTGIGANFNFRLKKFNFFMSYNFNYRDDISDGYTKTEYFNGGDIYDPDIQNHDDATQVAEQITERDRHNQGHTLRGGLDYYITDNDIISFATMLRRADGHNTPVVSYIDRFPFEDRDAFSRRAEDWRNKRPMMEYTLDYDKYFNTKDNYLKASFRYFKNAEEEWSDITDSQYLTREDMESDLPIPDSTIFQHTSTKETHENFQGTVDFAYHLGQHAIEAGAKYENKFPSNAATVTENGTPLEPYCHDFRFNKQVAALYGSYGTTVGFFSFLVGARYEYSYISSNYVDKNQKYEQRYHNIFPSGHVNFKVTEKDQLQLSYTRRIRRPGYWQMAPYSSFNDDRNIRRGNPELRPVYTDSYEFSYLKFWENGNFNLTGYYRHGTDIFRNFTEVDSLNVSVSMPQNFGTSDDYGLEITGQVNVFKWWSINGNINFFKSCTVGDYKGRHYTTDSYNLMGRLVSKFNFKKVCNLQFTGHFMGPRDEPLGFREANYWIDFAASRDILKDKATLSLNVRDLFGTRSHNGESWGDNFWQYSEGSWSKTTVTLNFNYRINDNGQKKQRNDNGGGEDAYDEGEGM